jgi:hypothetical protein
MTYRAVKASVNKHAEPGFAPPFHSMLAVGHGFRAFRFSIGWFWCGASGLLQLVLNAVAATAAPVPIRKRESRLEILFADMDNPPFL